MTTPAGDASEPTPVDLIGEAISRSAANIDPSGAVCAGWVLVATWISSDGHHILTRLSDECSPRWTTLGILRAAQKHYEHEMVFGLDDEDDED